MRLEIGREPRDAEFKYVFIIAAADLGHALGDRHHRADRRAAAGAALHADIGAAEFAQRGLGVAGRVEIESRLVLLDPLFLEGRLEQAVLVGEVDIEGALGDAAGARDLAHAGAVKAEVHEHLARAVEDLAAFCAFLFAGSRMLVWMDCNHWFSFREEIPRLRRPGRAIWPYVPSRRNVY